MDIICTCCGEPWDVDHVLHEEPYRFERVGALIKACPCCSGRRPKDLDRATCEQLEAVAEASRLFGSDIDGFVAFLEDMLLTY